jgi:hypothetical protein
MNRFNELLEKRKNLTATILEEEELIEMSKTLTKEQLKDIDKTLLTYSNSDRLDSLNSKLDELLATIKK